MRITLALFLTLGLAGLIALQFGGLGDTTDRARTERQSEQAVSSLTSLNRPPVRPPAPPPEISVADYRLSLHVNNRSLPVLLDEIARQSGITITIDPGLTQERLSVHLQDMALDQGLLLLLQEFDVFFRYDADALPAPLQAVWVYPKGSGWQLLPAAPVDPVRTAGSGHDPAIRTSEQTVDTVLQALQDPSDQARYQALTQALEAGLTLPVDRMVDLAQYDPSPVVRFFAFRAVVQATGSDAEIIRAIADNLRHDPASPLQNEAREVLDQLNRADSVAEPDTPLPENSEAATR